MRSDGENDATIATVGREAGDETLPRRKRISFNWIEVHVASHCNIRCNGCSHHSPFVRKRFYDLERYRRDLTALSKVARVNFLWLLGGEPLLNERLSDFLAISKKIGFSKLNGISTNGVLLSKASDAIFDAVDYIFVSLYPAFEKNRGKIVRLLREKSRGRRFTFNVIGKSHFYDVETRDAKPLSAELAQQSYRNCDRAIRGQFVEDGYFYKCMRPVSTEEYLRNRGCKEDLPDFRKVDGVAIHAPDLHGRLKAYMESSECLQSCFYCTMGIKNQSKVTLWRRIKSKFEFNGMLQNLIYRSRALLYLSHAFQDIFERHFARKIGNRQIDIGVPLTVHRLLRADEVCPRAPEGRREAQ